MEIPDLSVSQITGCIFKSLYQPTVPNFNFHIRKYNKTSQFNSELLLIIIIIIIVIN